MATQASIQTTLPETGYLRLPQILQFIPVGRSTWWKWVAEGKAPAPVKLAPKTTAWKVESIRQFITDLEKNGAENEH